MPTPEIRVHRANDDDRYLATDQLVWFEEILPGPAEELIGPPPDQRFAALTDDADPGTYPGVYGVFPLRLAVPGDRGRARLVPCAGLTWVGVHPDHRRRGALTAMLRHHVEQTHREGVALSALHASEPEIYGRHGYGAASYAAATTLARGITVKAPGLDAEAGRLRTSLATMTDAGVAERIHACLELVAATAPGTVVGERDFYAYVVQQSVRPEAVRDKEPVRVLFAQRDGEDVGVATFRRHQKWEGDRPKGRLEVFMLEGDPAPRLALLRRLLDFDLIAETTIPRVGVDDPLWSWIGPRGASKVEPSENLWVRLVDLAAALPLRTYGADCDLVVDVEDPAAPWQAGRWRLHVRAGTAEVTRTDRTADLELPVAVLGAAYLGGANLVALHRAGLLDERRPGAVAELSRVFATDLAPTPAHGF